MRSPVDSARLDCGINRYNIHVRTSVRSAFLLQVHAKLNMHQFYNTYMYVYNISTLSLVTGLQSPTTTGTFWQCLWITDTSSCTTSRGTDWHSCRGGTDRCEGVMV